MISIRKRKMSLGRYSLRSAGDENKMKLKCLKLQAIKLKGKIDADIDSVTRKAIINMNGKSGIISKLFFQLKKKMNKQWYLLNKKISEFSHCLIEIKCKYK